jgi:tricorn protease-like protein
MSRAYCRFPTVFLGKVVFTSEDDLWEVGLDGGFISASAIFARRSLVGLRLKRGGA